MSLSWLGLVLLHSPVSLPVDSPATERPGFIENNVSATLSGLPLVLHCPCLWLYLMTRPLRLLRRWLPRSGPCRLLLLAPPC
ncbi:hypothetical protein DFH09DRAFT_1132511 [Mycena vulgaris]|nr:hypothetical protein DFH09DRAFT_1132511 [Mycena vulgaris]